MELFCGNAFTGEDLETVTNRMQHVVDTLNQAGHQAYCPVFDPHKKELQEQGDTKAIFAYALENIKKADGMVAIITSDRKSEGLLMEIGAVLLAQKPLFTFTHSSVGASHVPKLATKNFIWTTEEELQGQLATIPA
jgi:nucleoside 2-deoxyribosyltransferase